MYTMAIKAVIKEDSIFLLIQVSNTVYSYIRPVQDDKKEQFKTILNQRAYLLQRGNQAEPGQIRSPLQYV